MTECNGCGGCCNPVVMPYSQLEALGYEMPPEQRHWMLEDLTPMSEEEAIQLEPDLVLRHREGFGLGAIHYYSCRHYSVETRMCTNYAHRPPMCRIYPWLPGKAVPGQILPASCSFRADIGETPYPIPDLTS